MGKYAGKTFTVLNSDVVDAVISINEDDGYSEILKHDPDNADGYLLQDSHNLDEGFWLIGDSHIEELLAKRAVTIS